jgi:peptidyl-prolyl cis-trans isomerase B (cyclophilin B)
MKTIAILFCLFLTTFALSCGDTKTANTKSTNANAEVTKGVTPIADSEVAVIEMETPVYGEIKIELYSNVAPKMVERFKTLAREGYYDGIAFHRINQSVIQAGNSHTKPGATPDPLKEGDSGKPNVVAEFSDLKYDTGTLGAARLGNDVNSANSQFFITLKREPAFDNKYTIFGKVIEGMNNVRTISGVEPKEGERPIEPVRIKTVRIVPR